MRDCDDCSYGVEKETYWICVRGNLELGCWVPRGCLLVKEID